MRLEVIADNRGAVIYVLNRPEIYIGSTDSNDIVIPSKEISKKHLKVIVTDDERCFIIDQGSTNGTFLNDERLIPGRREEFKVNTSIRLGFKVLITLLGKDKGALPELPLRDQFVEEKKIKISDEDKTRVISLKTLQKSKTEKVRKKRLKKLEKEISRKKQVRKDKATINQAVIMALVVIAVAWGAMKAWDLHKKRKSKQTVIGRLKETQLIVDDKIESSLEEVGAETLIDPSVLLSVDEISKHAGDVNCSLPEESFFCKRMPRGSRKKNGALNINNQIVLYLEQDEWLSRAQSLVATYGSLTSESEPVSDSMKATEKRLSDQGEEDAATEDGSTDQSKGGEITIEMLHRIAFLAYFKQYLWATLPPEYQEYNLYVALYSSSDMSIERVLAIKARNLAKVNARFTEDFFKSNKYEPYKIITRLDRFYKIY